MPFESKIENNSEQEPKIKFERPKFHFEEIAQLKPPITKMLSELRENIDAGIYKVVLGDDASGRIPALIFGETLSNIYKAGGLKPPQVKFLAANPKISQQKLEDGISKMKSGLTLKTEDKMLMVTDTIGSGSHLAPLLRALKQKDVNFDVASIGITDAGGKTIKRFKQKWACKIVYGEEGVPRIYEKRRLAGVFKESRDLVSRRYDVQRHERETGEVRLPQDIQKVINFAREDVKNLSEGLSNAYIADSEYNRKTK